MSRIGKNPVEIPDGVTLEVAGQVVTAKGKEGELSLTVAEDVEITRDGNLVWVKPRNETLLARKLWGTTRSLVNNLVLGVSAGFSRKLEVNGGEIGSPRPQPSVRHDGQDADEGNRDEERSL